MQTKMLQPKNIERTTALVVKHKTIDLYQLKKKNTFTNGK